MAQEHFDAVQKALDELVTTRREIVERLGISGQTSVVWRELREVQETIEALIRARQDEKEGLPSVYETRGVRTVG